MGALLAERYFCEKEDVPMTSTSQQSMAVQGAEPDVVMGSCGDVPTMESLAATALLRRYLPDIKIRFVNVVDLFKPVPHTEHPHGLTDREFEALFTSTKPVAFNFHSYPWLIHCLTYRRHGQHYIHKRGYKEKGNINTPLELAIPNHFSSAMNRHRIAMGLLKEIFAGGDWIGKKE
jgi:phosphoketolase